MKIKVVKVKQEEGIEGVESYDRCKLLVKRINGSVSGGSSIIMKRKKMKLNSIHLRE